MPLKELLVFLMDKLGRYEHAVNETEDEKFERINRTLDELPDIIVFMLALESYFDLYATTYMKTGGVKDPMYMDMRVRRDSMERMVKGARQRYDGASRVITLQGTEMSVSSYPRSRA